MVGSHERDDFAPVRQEQLPLGIDDFILAPALPIGVVNLQNRKGAEAGHACPHKSARFRPRLIPEVDI